MPDPPYLQALKGEMPIMKMGWFKSYKASFIDANRFRPVVHIITGIMLLGYTLEYFHHLKGEPQPPSLALCNGTTGAPLPHPLFPFSSSPPPSIPFPATDFRHKNLRKHAFDEKH